MAADRGEAPKRQRVLLDKLKPPPRHRKQPDPPEQQVFDAVKARNERRSLAQKYRKHYQGRHWKGK